MPNMGNSTVRMDGLWKKQKLWEILTLSGRTEESLRAELDKDGVIAVKIPDRAFVGFMRKYIPEDVLQGMFRAKYLEGADFYPDMLVTLSEEYPDSATTIARYTTDDRLALILPELYPDERVYISWVVEGTWDYGSCTIYQHQVFDDKTGNLIEEIEADGEDEEEEYSSSQMMCEVTAGIYPDDFPWYDPEVDGDLPF